MIQKFAHHYCTNKELLSLYLVHSQAKVMSWQLSLALHFMYKKSITTCAIAYLNLDFIKSRCHRIKTSAKTSIVNTIADVNIDNLNKFC